MELSGINNVSMLMYENLTDWNAVIWLEFQYQPIGFTFPEVYFKRNKKHLHILLQLLRIRTFSWMNKNHDQ